jgi:hypothetical protein
MHYNQMVPHEKAFIVNSRMRKEEKGEKYCPNAYMVQGFSSMATVHSQNKQMIFLYNADDMSAYLQEKKSLSLPLPQKNKFVSLFLPLRQKNKFVSLFLPLRQKNKFVSLFLSLRQKNKFVSLPW